MTYRVAQWSTGNVGRHALAGIDARPDLELVGMFPDIGPEWPRPAGQGCCRVVVTGEPNDTLDLKLLGSDGDHHTAGLKGTVMRPVNTVPAVVAAPPGRLTVLDLPLVTGRGLA